MLPKNLNIQAGITLKSVKWAFTNFDQMYWHPLTWLSHMLDCELYGLEPGMHHLTSLLFHIVNTLLLFLVFRKMTGSLWQSAFVAALFALHPINVDTVAWGGGTEECSEHFSLDTHHVYLRSLYREAGIISIYADILGLCPGPDGQTDACNPAVCTSFAGLLAPQASSFWSKQQR